MILKHRTWTTIQTVEDISKTRFKINSKQQKTWNKDNWRRSRRVRLMSRFKRDWWLPISSRPVEALGGFNADLLLVAWSQTRLSSAQLPIFVWGSLRKKRRSSRSSRSRPDRLVQEEVGIPRYIRCMACPFRLIQGHWMTPTSLLDNANSCVIQLRR